jgi:hypothetical protein
MVRPDSHICIRLFSILPDHQHAWSLKDIGGSRQRVADEHVRLVRNKARPHSKFGQVVVDTLSQGFARS